MTVAVVLAFLGALIFGWRQMVSRRELEAELRLAQRKLRDAAVRLQVPGEPARSEKVSTRSREDISAQDALTQLHQKIARARFEEATSGAKAQVELMASQEMQERLADRFRKNLSLRYGRFYVAQRLIPDQVRSFENAMMQRYYAMSDIAIATRTTGASDVETTEFRRRQLSDLDEQLRESLGEPLHREFLRYDISASAVPLVEQVAGKLFSIGVSMTAEQGDQLAALINSHANRAMREAEWLHQQTLGYDSALHWTDIDWQAVIEKARATLSPVQMTTLQNIAVEAAFQQQLQAQLKEADRRGRKSASQAQGMTSPRR